MSKSEKIKFTRGDRIFSIICAIFFAVFAIVTIFNSREEIYQKEAIDGGVIAEAEFVKVAFLTSSGNDGFDSTTFYYPVYSYVDENGVEYSEWWVSFDDELEARSYIGKKIKIYIDGKGHSIPVGSKPAIGLMVTFSVLFLLAVLASIVMYIYQCFNKMTKEEEIEYEETDHELERINENKKKLNRFERNKAEMEKRLQQLEIELELSRLEREVVAEQKAEKERLWKEYREALKEIRNRGEDATFEEYLEYIEQQQKEKEIQE